MTRPAGALEQRAHPAFRWVLIGLLAALPTSCGSTISEGPHPRAASNAEAQAELRQLEGEWEVGSVTDRRALRVRLEEFVTRYGFDPAVGRARVLLAKIALMEERLGAAEELLTPVLAGPPGRTRDEALIVLAGIVDRRGDHAQALTILEPLEGKVLTGPTQYEYSQRRVTAAIGARRWRLAVDAMTTWIEVSNEREQDAKDWVLRSLASVPVSAQARILEDWAAEPEAVGEQEARDWMRRALIENLTQVALARQDAELARALLRTSPTWLRASDAGDELALLAALAEDEAKISGRMIGVVMGGESARMRRRSVHLATGLVQGLDLGRAGEPDDDGVTLLAEDVRDSVSAALATLMGNGASVLVAGVSPVQAAEALRFAESRRVPVIVLSDPGELQSPGDFGFVFGTSEGQEREVISGAVLAPSDNPLSEVAFVGGAESACEPPLVRPGVRLFPVGRWEAQGVDALGILGDAHCARRVVEELRTYGLRIPVVLGLEAASGPLPDDWPLWSVQAGSFPQRRDRLGSDRFNPESETDGAPAADWYTVLGQDIARLLSGVLEGLPEATTRDPAAVSARHQEVRVGLLSAQAQLLSTRSRGFGGGHRLDRQLAVNPVEEVRP